MRVDSGFARKTGLKVTSVWPTTTCSSTAPEQSLKATRKTPAGDRQSGCLSPSALPAHSLHMEKASPVSLMVPFLRFPQWARLSYGKEILKWKRRLNSNDTAHTKQGATHVPILEELRRMTREVGATTQDGPPSARLRPLPPSLSVTCRSTVQPPEKVKTFLNSGAPSLAILGTAQSCLDF